MVLRKRLLPLLLTVFSLSAPALFAQGLSVSIRLFNEDIYFPDSVIEIYVTIQNETSSTQRFRLADDRNHNLVFEARTEGGTFLGPDRKVTTEARLNQVYYRTVSLDSGDRFSFVERLTDYVSFDDPGLYALSVSFFPEMVMVQNQTPLRSNTIPITIRPGETPERRAEQQFQAIAVTELQRQQLAPDDTVRYMLEARRQSNWDQFFLYLNLEKLYRQAPERDRSFRREMSEEEQRQTLDRYREELIAGAGPRDSSLTPVPDSYEIIRTTYTAVEGTVVAELRFDFDRYRERRRYQYFLERRNGFWEIIGYDVTNLPNEAIGS
ncbi:MAG: hypothetical protein WCY01_01120 [Alkalispirochaeta sp.]